MTKHQIRVLALIGALLLNIGQNSVSASTHELVVAEDTDWLLKMALTSKLVAGNIKEAVAMRGVHETNIFNQTEQYKIHRQKMYESVICWSFQNNIGKTKIDLLLNWLFYYRYKEKYSLMTEFKYWFCLLKSNPKLLTSTFKVVFPLGLNPVRKRKRNTENVVMIIFCIDVKI